MGAYATRLDLEALGIRREALVASSRVVALVDPATDRLAVTGSGYRAGDALQFSISGIPGESVALPTPLSSSTVYYALPIADSDSLFQVSTTPNGSAVDITDTGSGVAMVTQQIGTMIDAVLLAMSGRVDEALVNYDSPLETWPAEVTTVVCSLSAWHLMVVRGLADPGYEKSALDGLRRAYDDAEKQLERWRAGAPLLGVPKASDDTPSILENGTANFSQSIPDWLSSCSSTGQARIG